MCVCVLIILLRSQNPPIQTPVVQRFGSAGGTRHVPPSQVLLLGVTRSMCSVGDRWGGKGAKARQYDIFRYVYV